MTNEQLAFVLEQVNASISRAVDDVQHLVDAALNRTIHDVVDEVPPERREAARTAFIAGAVQSTTAPMESVTLELERQIANLRGMA